MAWRYHGRAKVDPEAPEAFAECDRCGFWYNRSDLVMQYQWVGSTLQSVALLVCDICLDVPNEGLRSIVLPADPPPFYDARPTNFPIAELDYLITQDDDTFVTGAGDYLVTSPVDSTG